MSANQDKRHRLDVRLHQLFPSISRAQLQRFIKSGFVKVNKKTATISKHPVSSGDTVQLNEKALEQPKTDVISIDVIYEDDDSVVINKPAGILSHSKGAYNPEPTVATWLHSKVPDFRGDRDGIVHRLDRSTSGVMICAKNEGAHIWLQKQFSQRKVHKTYIAKVEGELSTPKARIDLPIERNPSKPQRFRVHKNGKAAQTDYTVLEVVHHASDVTSLIELRPVTGRTHQLRVHMKYLGHPIIGDIFYGGKAAERLYLHARDLELILPNRKKEKFSATVPESFYKS